ncbi:hypothetical protein LCDVSa011L [Lymphocystis disease virus 3]|uniref:Uncharacterized protein n=1 Tax=Lymphocystis disease virus 3 TaxID=2560566 RepID=A0A1B2RVS5_9VIRU|nr:hypothetical protein BZK12_gp011 [Lymphocystis disease virus Sa]AOC55095.1 hypothetical protein LCDVSa011L [Lymphocystis disease virus 3]
MKFDRIRLMLGVKLLIIDDSVGINFDIKHIFYIESKRFIICTRYVKRILCNLNVKEPISEN